MEETRMASAQLNLDHEEWAHTRTLSLAHHQQLTCSSSLAPRRSQVLGP